MTAAFHDRFPDRPRILFLGEIHSSHAQSWIRLLDNAALNVRAFSLPTGLPPPEFSYPTYVSFPPPARGGAAARRLPLSQRRPHFLVYRVLNRARRPPEVLASLWLRHIMRRWRPDIVHILGLRPAGEFWHALWKNCRPTCGKTVLQLRGGSDLVFHHNDPMEAARLRPMLEAVDAIISDNELNFEYMTAMGVSPIRRASLGRVPGTGGVDVDKLAARWSVPPSGRRDILWPKAYEAPWSKALPILEALQIAWPRLPACRILIYQAYQREVHDWLRNLPPEILACCVVRSREPRDAVIDAMLEARVMLAPALVDGTPNVMWEAMACGAIPIVSPLPTIAPLVREPENVLFARNLYPHEIAEALVRATTDDALADRMAAANVAAVRALAGRDEIAARVIAFYNALAPR
jgi:glycosyltransferase involved in cell wall biosynthesis